MRVGKGSRNDDVVPRDVALISVSENREDGENEEPSRQFSGYGQNPTSQHRKRRHQTLQIRAEIESEKEQENNEDLEKKNVNVRLFVDDEFKLWILHEGIEIGATSGVLTFPFRLQVRR